MVMEPTDFWDGNHPALVWSVDGARLRTIHCQRQMGPPVVIIGKVTRQEAPQMLCIEHEDMVQTFPPDASDETLDIGILPRTAGRNHNLFDPHVLDALPKDRAVYAVAIAQEIAWRLVPRKGLHHLLGRPLGSWMLGHVEMNHASALVRNHHQDEEDSERHGWHGKEVQGHKILHVVLEKRLPCRGRRLPTSSPVFLYCRFRHVDAQLPQFPHDPRR